MLSRSEQESLRDLLADSIMLFCSKAIKCDSEIAVKALVGVTVDCKQAYMLDINSTMYKDGSNSPQGSLIKKHAVTGRLGGKSLAQAHTELHSYQKKPKRVIKSRKRKMFDADEPSEIHNSTKGMDYWMQDIVTIAEAVQSKSLLEDKDTDEANKTTQSSPEEDEEEESEPMETYAAPVSGSQPPNEPTQSIYATAAVPSEQAISLGAAQHLPESQHGPSAEPAEQLVLEADAIVDGSEILGDDLSSLGADVIEGEVLSADGLDEQEKVLIMASSEAEADGQVTELSLKPGETFVFEGTTYQIAPDEDKLKVKEEIDLATSPAEVGDVRRGNHVKSKKEKRFMCVHCSQMFTTNWALKLHERLHRGLFRYHCHICKKGFTVSSNLRGHMAKHTMQKEFMCEHCGKEFAYGQSLDKHIKRAKPGNPCAGFRTKSSASFKTDRARVAALPSDLDFLSRRALHIKQEDHVTTLSIDLNDVPFEVAQELEASA